MWVVAGIGALIRIRQFASGRSLWMDEALVANDISERTPFDLLTSPSPRGQMAPAGFWIVEKAAFALSPSAEALRLFPLLAGLAMVGLSVWYAERHLRSFPARLALVASISLSPSLIHYSAETKQYVLEALVTLMLTFAAASRARLHLWQLTLIGVVALLFSIPALVLVPLLAMLYAFESVADRGLAEATHRLGPAAVILGASQAAASAFVLGVRLRLEDFWSAADAYMPLPTSPEGVGWLARTGSRTVWFAYYHLGIITRPPQDPLDNPLWVVTALALLVVCVVGIGLASKAAWRASRPLWQDPAGAVFVMGTVIVAVMLVLSWQRTYPFHGRLSIYLFPLLFIVLAHAVDSIHDRFPRGAVVAGTAIAILAVPSAAGIFVKPYDRFDVVEALGWIEGRPQPGDVIVYSPAAAGEVFRFHRGEFDFGATAFRHYDGLDGDELAPLADGNTVWYFLPFVTARNDQWVDDLLNDERVIDWWRGDGAVALAIRPNS